MAPTDRRPPRRPVSELRQAFRECRWLFVWAGFFGLLANLLMLAQPIYMLQVYDRVLSTGHVETLVLLTVIIVGVLAVWGILDGLRNTILSRIGHWLLDRVGPRLLDVSVKSRLHGDASGAQLLRELGKARSFISAQGIGTFFDAPWVPLFLFVLAVLHPWLGVLGLATAFLMLGLALANDLCTRSALTESSKAQIAANGFAESAVRNAEVISAMGMRDALNQRWQSYQDEANVASEAANERQVILLAVTKFVRITAQIGVLGLGALLVLRQELTPGGMIAGSIVLSKALQPVERAMSAWRTFTNARLAQSRINRRLENFPVDLERTRLPDPVGELRVEKVTYDPRSASRPILEEVSFALDPGEALAVIGPSAAGKSTLCRLVIGIQNPTEGKIRLDGADLSHWDAQELGRFVGYLPQDVELFGGTVRDNIGRMLDTASDDAIVEAAKLAHAHDMIMQLQNGYETQIGDAGARLSGGQRQRIGLARALFGDPKLIVLDEPNANLDQSGESALAAAIGDLKARGATIVMVGHRPSTLHQVDKVMVLQKGRVAGLGPREKILSQLRKSPGNDDSANDQPAPKTAEPVASGGRS